MRCRSRGRSGPGTSIRRARPISCRRCWPRCACSATSRSSRCPTSIGPICSSIFGANPIVSNGSLMTAPNIKGRLRAIRDRGGRIVVVDPRRTETAEMADEHVADPPGHRRAASRRHAARRLRRRLDPPGALRRPGQQPRRPRGRSSASCRRSASLAEPASTPRRRAGSPASSRARRAPRATAASDCARSGTARWPSWLVQALNLVTGHLDEVGGMMLTTPAVDVVTILSRAGMRGTYDRWRSRARQLPEFGGDLPVATLADEIELDGRGRVRALVTVAGNPVLSAPNGRRLDRALATLDHVVSIDSYLNETTRHAHVLLPPASPLSRGHYDLALYAFSVRNVAKYSAPVVPRQASERLDWEILGELGGRVFVPRPFRRLAVRAARRLRPERIVDVLLRLGPYRLTLAKLRAVSARDGSRPARARSLRRSHRHARSQGRPRPGRFRSRGARTAGRRRRPRDDGRAGVDRTAPASQQQLLDAQLPSPGQRPAALHPPRPSRRCQVAASGRWRSGPARIGGGHDRRPGRSERRDAARRRQSAARLGSRSRGHPPGGRARACGCERQRRDERPAPRHAQRHRRLQRTRRHLTRAAN